jgi:hypothetical protein
MNELKTSNPYTLTTEQYQELYKEVLLFAEIGGVTQDEDGIWKMCQEEYINELIPATEAEDALGVIDATADSFVVLAQLHHYYLSKPSWEQPLYDDIGWEDAPFFRLEGMLLNRQENLVPSCVANWLDVAKTCAKEYNFNLYKAIKEVNRSNMTKFPSVAEVSDYMQSKGVAAGQMLEEMSKGKNKDVVINFSDVKGLDGQMCVVFRADGGKGKIVKWPGFQEPNFDHCWL